MGWVFVAKIFFFLFFFFFGELLSPAARILGFEKVLLMVQKNFFALRAKTSAKLLLVASGGETHVPQARSEFLRISDICSFLSPGCALYSSVAVHKP